MSGALGNVYLAKVCAVAGIDDSQCAIERVLRDFRSGADTLREIAGKCGVDEIVEEPLSFDGGIFRLPGNRTVIKLNSQVHPSRRRFTLAHEIGHVVIGSVTNPRGTFSCRKSVNLEHACNMIAAELLMPAAEVKMAVDELRFSSPRNLRTLADKFGVSMQSAAVRVHQDLRLWKRRIGMWQWDSILSEVWFVGKRPWATKTPGFSAFESARNSEQTVRSLDVTRHGERIEPVSLELLNIGCHRILGLVGVVP